MKNTMMPYAGKHILIPFTSGQDSTLIAYLALEAGCNVTLCNMAINTPQASVERDNAKAMCELLKSNYLGKVKIRYLDERLPINMSAKFQQMATIAATLPLVVTSDVDYVALGWLATDGTWHLADKLKEQFKAATSWNVNNPIHAEVIFPLIERCKVEVVSALPAEYLQQTHWCEAPVTVAYHLDFNPGDEINYGDGLTIRNMRTNLACGKCPSCRDIDANHHRKFKAGTWYYERETILTRYRFNTKAEINTVYRMCRKAVSDTAYAQLPPMNELFSSARLPHPFYSDVNHEYGHMFGCGTHFGHYRLVKALVADTHTVNHAARTLAMQICRVLQIPAEERVNAVAEITNRIENQMRTEWKAIYPHCLEEDSSELDVKETLSI